MLCRTRRRGAQSSCAAPGWTTPSGTPPEHWPDFEMKTPTEDGPLAAAHEALALHGPPSRACSPHRPMARLQGLPLRFSVPGGARLAVAGEEPGRRLVRRSGAAGDRLRLRRHRRALARAGPRGWHRPRTPRLPRHARAVRRRSTGRGGLSRRGPGLHPPASRPPYWQRRRGWARATSRRCAPSCPTGCTSGCAP
jgi:hypothetical protein